MKTNKVPLLRVAESSGDEDGPYIRTSRPENNWLYNHHIEEMGKRSAPTYHLAELEPKPGHEKKSILFSSYGKIAKVGDVVELHDDGNETTKFHGRKATILAIFAPTGLPDIRTSMGIRRLRFYVVK